MRSVLILLILLVIFTPAHAQTPPDYWDTDGVVTMDTWRWFDMDSLNFIEAWLRFAYTPITVWGNPPDNQQTNFEKALAAITPYLSVQRIADPALADIQVRFTSENEIRDAYGISQFLITDDGVLRSLVVIEIRNSTCSLILHELIHALGVRVHSPYENDIMHTPIYRECSLSERDINTLLRLYSSPVVSAAQLLDYAERRHE